MEISKSNIDSYLEKYYAGQTATAEEEALRHFFLSSDVPSKYNAEKALFNALNQGYEPLPIEEIKGLISSSINSVGAPPSHSSRFKLNIIRISVAASILVAIGIGWLLTMQSPNYVLVDTYSDPIEAYHETKRILSLVSTTMHTGTSQIEPLSRIENPVILLEPLEEISKQIEALKLIDEVINHPYGINLLRNPNFEADENIN